MTGSPVATARYAHAWAVVVGVVLLGAASAALLPRLHADGDLLAALPADAPEVKIFRDITERFGGLDVAQVAVFADDVLTPAFLEQLRLATQEVQSLPGIKHALSLTTVADFVPDPTLGGIVSDSLVAHIPTDAAGVAALRAKVLSRKAVVGNLIAADARAVQMVCFLRQGQRSAEVANAIAGVLQARFPAEALAFSGAPFIEAYVASATGADIAHLVPWATAAMVAVLLLGLGDGLGVLLVLVSTGLAMVIWLGGLALCGVHLTPVLSTLPVLLLAVGTTYNLHVLQRCGRADSWHALVRCSQPTITAALVTAAALAVLGAIPGTRAFGLVGAAGVLTVLLVAMVWLPAAQAVLRRQPRSGPLGHWFNRLPVPGHTALVIYAVVVAASVALLTRLPPDVDLASLMGPTSAPVVAMQRIGEHFGGAQLLQVELDGDFNDPLVLRELQWFADRVALLPGVVGVSHIGEALVQANAAMEGLHRLPDSRDKAQMLYNMVGSDPALHQLISHDADHTVLFARMADNAVPAVIAAVEQLAAQVTGPRITVASPGDARGLHVLRQRLAARVLASAKLFGVPTPGDTEALLLHTFDDLPEHAADVGPVRLGLARFLGSEECAVPLPGPQNVALREAAAAGVVDLGPTPSVVAVAASLDRVLKQHLTGEDIDDLALALQGPLEDLWQLALAEARADRLLAAANLPPLPADFRSAAVSALMDLRSPTVLVAAPASKASPQELQAQVTGQPLLNRALTRSLWGNEAWFVGAAALILLVGMTLWCRSFYVGALAATPALTGIALTGAAMVLLDLRLDMSTLTITALVVALGVDYAVHGMAALQRPGDVPAIKLAVGTSALALAAEFVILGLAHVRPLQALGLLTAVAALAAAVATGVVLPAVATSVRRALAKHSH